MLGFCALGVRVVSLGFGLRLEGVIGRCRTWEISLCIFARCFHDVSGKIKARI